MKLIRFMASSVLLICVPLMGGSDVDPYLCPSTNSETMSRVFCNNEPVILDCLDTQYISWIKVKYGRTSDPYCGNINHRDALKVITDCTEESNVKEIINQKCRYKEFCNVKSSLLNAPECDAQGSKYVNVTYTCHEVVDLEGDPQHAGKERACQDENITLSCDIPGTNIVVSSAIYGRTNPFSCYNGNKNTNSLTCRAANSTTAVESHCEGLRHCTINATNSLFGDPCPTIYKYLETIWFCVPA
uniref:D-galactoside-specific lectin n=2 Tax=Lygus hesperus TaxID=30085 RepID=A0A0A9ZAL9_LYGHE